MDTTTVANDVPNTEQTTEQDTHTDPDPVTSHVKETITISKPVQESELDMDAGISTTAILAAGSLVAFIGGLWLMGRRQRT